MAMKVGPGLMGEDGEVLNFPNVTDCYVLNWGNNITTTTTAATATKKKCKLIFRSSKVFS